jgi:hypothetical protein
MAPPDLVCAGAKTQAVLPQDGSGLRKNSGCFAKAANLSSSEFFFAWFKNSNALLSNPKVLFLGTVAPGCGAGVASVGFLGDEIGESGELLLTGLLWRINGRGLMALPGKLPSEECVLALTSGARVVLSEAADFVPEP